MMIVLGALSVPAQTNLSEEVEKLLPVGKCQVEVMGVVYPQRFLELSEKMTIAVSTNKDWWFDYIKNNAKEGEPLPYSPQFGITKKEYEEYLSLGEKRTLGAVKSTTLIVKTNSVGIEFDGGSDLADLTGVKINLKKLAITTPFAVLKNPSKETNPDGPGLGAYAGYQWKYETGDLEKGNVTEASFLVGKQQASGKNFIYYKAGEMKATNSVSEVRICIRY